MQCVERAVPLVWTVFSLLVLISICPDRMTTEAAVNPTVDGDGNIVWGKFDPIPPSELDNWVESIIRPQVVADMAHNFGVLVVNGLPYEAIRDTLIDLQDGGISSEDQMSTYWELAGGFVGVWILVLFGVILFLVMPIIGFCFCCCRCCGNCGGKRTQVDSNLGCKRVTLSLVFVALLCIMIPGMAFTNSANDFQRSTLLASNDAFYTITDGFNNYTKDVLKQVEYMVDVQYMFVDNLIRENLTENTIGTDVTDYIREDLGVGEVEESLNSILTGLQSTETAMGDIKSGREELVSSEDQLKSNLSSIKTDIESINSSCSGCLNPFGVVVLSDFNQLPEVTDEDITDISKGINSMENISREIDNSLKDVENEIQRATNASVQEALSTLDTTKDTVEEAFKDIEDTVKEVEKFIKDSQRDVNLKLEEYEPYVDYGWYFFLAVTCTILFILVIMILGLTMGTICYSRGSPLDRSKMSNSGGNCLMAGVFFMFLFFPLFIILTCVLFGGFSIATSTCEPLKSLELYKETIDYRNTIVPGYFLGDAIYGNGSYEVTFSGVLEACQRNDTLYNAIKMDYVFNFEDLKKEFDQFAGELDKFIEDVEDIPLDFDVFPSNLESSLQDLVTEVGLGDFDADSYKIVLNQSILSKPSLNAYADYLEAEASKYQDQSDEMEKAALDLRNIQTSLVESMETTVNKMEQDVDTVDTVAESLQNNVDETIHLTNEVETGLNLVNETEVAKNVTEEYVSALIGYGDSYIEQTEHQVTNDFAACRNVWDIYYVTLQYSCDNLFDSWNAIWFTLGWCTFFFIPSIIISVKLAKHYRIMKHVLPPKPKKQKNTRSSDEEVGMNDMNGYHSNAYDERLLYQDGGRGGMTPVDNPQFIQERMYRMHNMQRSRDEPIMAYDYKGNPIAPPPAYNYDDLYPRHRASLLSPYPWTHQINGPFPKERKYWDRDLWNPPAISGRLKSQEPSFDEDPNRGESTPYYITNKPYSYVSPTGKKNSPPNHGAIPPPRPSTTDMRAYNRYHQDDTLF